jgi:hypothetical protein
MIKLECTNEASTQGHSQAVIQTCITLWDPAQFSGFTRGQTCVGLKCTTNQWINLLTAVTMKGGSGVSCMPMAYEPAGPGTYDMGVWVLYDLDDGKELIDVCDLVRLDFDIPDILDHCLLC